MKSAAVLLVAFVHSGAFARESGQPLTPASPPQPGSAQTTVMADVRQANNSDLIVKEMRSPITFDLDASWLPTLSVGATRQLGDVPMFYCEGVTISGMAVTRLQPKAKGADGTLLNIEYWLRKRRQPGDRLLVMEFVLLNGDQRLLLEHRDGIPISDTASREFSSQVWIPKDTVAAFTAEGSTPRLRVSMIALMDAPSGAVVPLLIPVPLP